MTCRSWLPPTTLALVLLTGVALALTRPAPGPGPDLRRVLGEGTQVQVGARWSGQPRGSVLYYADPAGRPVAAVRGAVVADAGSCAGDPGSHRGFAGSTRVGQGPIDDLHAASVARWASGITGRAHPPAAAEEVRLVDGTPALRTRERLRTPADDDPCTAQQVVLDLVSLPSGGGVVAFVLVRDVDPDGVTDAEADAILQSLRSRT